MSFFDTADDSGSSFLSGAQDSAFGQGWGVENDENEHSENVEIHQEMEMEEEILEEIVEEVTEQIKPQERKLSTPMLNAPRLIVPPPLSRKTMPPPLLRLSNRKQHSQTPEYTKPQSQPQAWTHMMPPNSSGANASSSSAAAVEKEKVSLGAPLHIHKPKQLLNVPSVGRLKERHVGKQAKRISGVSSRLNTLPDRDIAYTNATSFSGFSNVSNEGIPYTPNMPHVLPNVPYSYRMFQPGASPRVAFAEHDEHDEDTEEDEEEAKDERGEKGVPTSQAVVSSSRFAMPPPRPGELVGHKRPVCYSILCGWDMHA